MMRKIVLVAVGALFIIGSALVTPALTAILWLTGGDFEE